MIVVFHCLINCIYTYLNKIKCVQNIVSANFTISNHLNDPYAERTITNDIKFDPPLYKQRYQRVAQILLDERWRNQIKTLVDFGCAELDLFVYLKNLNNLNKTVFVDIDEEVLTGALFKVQPLIADHINRLHNLNVKVFVGSVSEPDDCLKDIDAVIAVELIEHLYPDVLEAFPYNIFQYIHPKLAIFTTPNAEFNQLFPDRTGFRHEDHKFEWTRKQFQSWCLNIVERFPNYAVAFDGVGLAPDGVETFGTCTQLACFVRKDIICDTICNIDNQICMPKKSYGICSYYSYSKQISTYKLIADIHYPYLVDHRSEDEKILDEIKYRVSLFNHTHSMFFNCSTNRLEIPLEKLIYGNYGQFITVPELRGLLLKLNYTVEECCIQETDCAETCLIINLEMNSSDTQTNSEADDASGYESDNKFNANDSDWDDPAPATVQNSTKQQQCALYDSGYQKSPLNDESPNNYVGLLNKAIVQTREITDDNINELDKIEVMRGLCNEIEKYSTVAGPSNIKKLSNESSIDSDDNSSINDVKSLTNCILENSLNQIEQPEEEIQLIEQYIERPLAIIGPIMVVENGDLANNNRDLEGNNYPAVNIDDNIDDNVEELIDNQRHNQVNIVNNNEVIVNNVIEDIGNDQIDDQQEAIDEDAEVAWPSREALFDSNSHIDLLDDFEMDAVQNDAAPINADNYLVINSSINPTEDDDIFPDWLIDIFNENEGVVQVDEDDPHFYSQGDSLAMTNNDENDNTDVSDDHETINSGTNTSTSTDATATSAASGSSSSPSLSAVGSVGTIQENLENSEVQTQQTSEHDDLIETNNIPE